MEVPEQTLEETARELNEKGVFVYEDATIIMDGDGEIIGMKFHDLPSPCIVKPHPDGDGLEFVVQEFPCGDRPN